MKEINPLVISFAAVLGLAGLVLLIPQARSQAKEFIYYSRCDEQLRYKIGSIDPRFGLTRDEAADDIITAETIWENEVNKNLFQNSSDAKLTINFVYDQRQALSSRVNELNNEVNQRSADLKLKIDQYKKDSVDFERRLNEFVNTVNKYNSEGGATEEIYNELIKQQNQLKSEAEALNVRARDLNLSTNDYNTEVGALNQNINQFNNVLSEKPEEGLYDGKEQTISIYFADKKDELIHTLAHEFGHALGAEHVKNKDSVMYSFTSGSLLATPEDLEELTYVCRKQPRILHWIFLANRWMYDRVESLQPN